MTYKKIYCLLIIISIVFFCQGCGTIYKKNAAELVRNSKIEDYGPKPPSNYPDLIKGYFADHLKDPESARYKFSEPFTAVIPESLTSTKPILVWVTQFTINAKNGFGGYSGDELYSMAWKNGEVVSWVKGGRGLMYTQ